MSVAQHNQQPMKAAAAVDYGQMAGVSEPSSKETAPAATKWLLASRQPINVADTAVQLFCVPQAGMGAWIYQAWADRLAPHIQVLPVELPGHGSRMKEPRVTNLCQLSQQAVAALEPHIRQGRYALFGHSMGAWIVWEMLQEITRKGLPLPLHLFVSGNRAASLHGAQHDVDPVRMHTLTPDEFWAHFKQRYGENKHLEDPAMQAYMYPMLRDDFELVEAYQPSNPEAKTTVPITAIGGGLDKRYTRDQVGAWSQHTSSSLTEVWLDNQGHNYIADCPQGLTAMLRMQLSPAALASQHPGPDAAATDATSTDAAAAPPAAAAAVTQGSKDQGSQAEAAQLSAGSEVPMWRRCCCAP